MLSKWRIRYLWRDKCNASYIFTNRNSSHRHDELNLGKRSRFCHDGGIIERHAKTISGSHGNISFQSKGVSMFLLLFYYFIWCLHQLSETYKQNITRNLRAGSPQKGKFYLRNCVKVEGTATKWKFVSFIFFFKNTWVYLQLAQRAALI